MHGRSMAFHSNTKVANRKKNKITQKEERVLLMREFPLVSGRQ
jgi:hypothetical protein